MKLETLKELIKKIPFQANIAGEEDVINNVLYLIDLYEQDNQQPVNSNPPPYPIPRPKLNPECLKGFGPRNEDC